MALSLLLAQVASANPPGDVVSLFAKSRHGVAHVGLLSPDRQTQRRVGTAFLVDGDCTFATAKHVIDLVDSRRKVDPERLIVKSSSPEEAGIVRDASVRVLYSDQGKDIAFLRSVGSACGLSSPLSLSPPRTGAEMLKLIGEPVLILGFPVLGKEEVDVPVVRSGIVASTEALSEFGPMILLDVQGVPGFSGGPVMLQRTGEVIGVVYGSGPTSREANFEWATPISTADYQRAVSGLEGSAPPSPTAPRQ